MTSLAEALLARRPRETSGTSSANRFGFQRTWALCHLLHLHATEEPYVLLLEFHDDVVVLDRDTDPQSVDFFQVKTRANGHWTIKNLLKISEPSGAKRTRSEAPLEADPTTEPDTPTNPSPRSILGKLLVHCRNFSPQVGRLCLVSNVSFNAPLANGTNSKKHESLSLADLSPDALTSVRDAMKAELAIEPEPPWEKVMLLTTGISIHEHETYGAGRLAKFLEARKPGARFAVQPLFRTICSELGRRSTNEWEPTSYEELCLKKGIRRSDFEAFLRHGDSVWNPHDELKEVKEQLRHESVDLREIMDIEAAWRKYDIERIDHSDLAVQAVREQLTIIVGLIHRSPKWRTLKDMVEEGVDTFNRRFGSPIPQFNTTYLKGALLYEFRSAKSRELSASDSQPSTGQS
jgi:hypothetical protein